VTATAGDATVLLRVEVDGRPSTASDLAIATPRGAIVAPGYAAFTQRIEDVSSRAWYMNPFEFFRLALQTDEVPKADATTLSGRRIYYSHIDGDGWRNLTRVEPYRSRYAIAARVVLERLVRPYRDLPVTVGAIVGDLDRAWQGSRESLAVARELYAEPHVEPAIHTYSHPFYWRSFDPDAHDDARSETAAAGPDLTYEGVEARGRAYGDRRFTLTLELDDAAAFVDRLLPEGKRTALIQWSGDTRPFEAALAHARAIGLANINGGDTRFDREFPSVAWVAPLGIRVGGELQVFASNSNENTYTDLWRDRFFGFSYLARTVRNTDVPRRLKPFNIYYHMYSGERLSSLNAVLANLDYARSLPLAPIETSRFSRIVEGFYATVFEPAGDRAWSVSNRGALQTIRFDRAALDGVDFARSRGVIGQRHQLGSLYVALDEAEATPVVALKRLEAADREPREPAAYLVESRWRVFNLRRESHGIRFTATGYGPGDFTWQWPGPDLVTVRWRAASGASGSREVQIGADGVLSVGLPQMTGVRVDVSIDARDGVGGGT
jgi:hypothetical protein